MNNKYESMSFCIDDYNSVEEMWGDISNFMRILLNMLMKKKEFFLKIEISLQLDKRMK